MLSHVKIIFWASLTACVIVTSNCGQVHETDKHARSSDGSQLDSGDDPNALEAASLSLTDTCPDPATAASHEALSCAKSALLDAASLSNPAETASKIGRALTWFKQANEAAFKLRPILEKLRPSANLQASAPTNDQNLARECFMELSKQIQGSFKAAEAIGALDQAQQSNDPVKAAAALVTLSRFALALTKSTHGSCVKMLTPELQAELNKIFGDAVKNLGVISTLLQCGVAITNGSYVLVGQTRLFMSDLETFYNSQERLQLQRKQCLGRTVKTETGCGMNFGIWLNSTAKTARGPTPLANFCASNCSTSNGTFSGSTRNSNSTRFWPTDSIDFCRQTFVPGGSCRGPAVDVCISMCCNQDGKCVESAQDSAQRSARQRPNCSQACNPQDVFIRDCTHEIQNSSVARDIQTCDLKGTGYKTANGCVVEECQSSTTKVGNTCRLCTPGEVSSPESCVTTGGLSGTRTKMCNASGTEFVFGRCEVCRPNETIREACTSSAGLPGTRTKRCNTIGTGFSLGTCQICSPNEVVRESCESSSGLAGTRPKTCNSLGTNFSFGACQICAPNEVISESCTSSTGMTGTQTKSCNSSGTAFLAPSKCRFCTPSAVLSRRSCEGSGGLTGTETFRCNSTGTDLVSSGCQICTPNESLSVEICQTRDGVSGSRTKTCNPSGTGFMFGHCQICKPNAVVSSNSCIGSGGLAGTEKKQCNDSGTAVVSSGCQVCTPNQSTTNSCIGAGGLPGTEKKQCNDSGTAVVSSGCQICTPNQSTTASCPTLPSNASAANRSGTCNSQGTGFIFGECRATSCFAGYTISNGQCKLCTPGPVRSSIDCRDEKPGSVTATKTEFCDSSGMRYFFSECQVSACNSGLFLAENRCNFCPPRSPVTVDCTSEKPNSTAASRENRCNTEGTNYSQLGSCWVRSCKPGYVNRFNACEVDPTSKQVSATADWSLVGTVTGNFSISASGTTFWAGQGSQATPDGIVGGDCCNSCNILQDAKHMTLIGRINGGTPFRVGSSYSGSGRGQLELRVNDRCQSDNGGSFTVNLQLAN